jgi:hypothetical protein
LKELVSRTTGVFGSIDNLGLLGDICHFLLGKRCPDDVSGQVFYGILLTRLNPWTAKNAKPGMTPCHEH